MCSFYKIKLKTSLKENCFGQIVDKNNKKRAQVFCTFFQKLCPLWDNLRASQVTNEYIIWCLPFACWITKVTGTHSEYEMFVAFPQQQLLCKCTLVLCVYICCLFCCICLWTLILASGLLLCYCHIIPYLVIRERMYNILITNCWELYLCRTDRSCCFTVCSTLMDDFLIYRQHRYVMMFLVSECRFLWWSLCL
jgi:hypothetical protein